MNKVRPIAPHLRVLEAPDGQQCRYIREFLAYDTDTGALVWRKKPLRRDGRPNNRVRVGQEAGWIDRTTGYRRVGVAGANLYAHRISYFLATGWWVEEIDHINGDKTDNRLCNLRAAFHAENARNVRRRTDNKSGHPGVSWCQRDKRWYASIAVDGKSMSLGRYDDLSDAIAARRRGEAEHHGEFAYHISRVEV